MRKKQNNSLVPEKCFCGGKIVKGKCQDCKTIFNNRGYKRGGKRIGLSGRIQ